MKTLFAIVTGMLLLAYSLPVAAEQSVPTAAQLQADPRVQQLQNEIAQLRQALRERTVNRQDAADDWQEQYEEKHEQLRERQQFQGEYLSHE